MTDAVDRISVLIVSFYFPPTGGGGVQRVLKWCEYLPEFGVDVHVLTPDNSRWIAEDAGLTIPPTTTVHRAPYRGFVPGQPSEILADKQGVSRLAWKLRLQPRRLMVPDVVAAWRLTAPRSGVRAVRRHRIDAVLSTSPPATDHLVARSIADQCDIPMIGDLRDSWLNDPRLRLSSGLVRAKRVVNQRYERRTIGAADAVVTAAPDITDEVTERHPHLAPQAHTILNGVDLADMPDEPTHVDDDHLVITHTGGFFGARRPDVLLQALLVAIDRRPALANDIRLRFVGDLRAADEQWLSDHPTVDAVVERVGFVAYDQALDHQASSDVVLLLIPDTPDRQGMLTGKLFEYLGTGNHVLALIPEHGAAADMIRRHDAGTVVASDDIDAAVAALLRLHDMWSDGSLTRAELTPELDDEISRRGGAQQLASVVRDAVTSARS